MLFSVPESRDGSVSQLPDEEIVRRVLAGEAPLFELLMRRHNLRLFRAARAIMRRDDEADDVMQDAYVRAYGHLAEFRGEARFSTWLTRIAVHEAFARKRRESRHASLESHPEERMGSRAEELMEMSTVRSPEQHAVDKETRALIERAIDALPEDFRIVFTLRAVEQMSGAETAEALGIPEQTVKTRLFRARERLQKNLLCFTEASASAAYDFHLTRCDRVVHNVLARLGIERR